MNRRGFATMTGLGLVLLIAAVLGTMSGWFAWEVRRTHRETADAQLRELLLAGAAAAPSHLAATAAAPAAPMPLPLPDNLTRQGGRVLIHLELASPAERRVTIEACLGVRHARQHLLFHGAPGAWRLTEAHLDR